MVATMRMRSPPHVYRKNRTEPKLCFVKSSVKSALAGINAQINSSLQENTKIIYSNMQAERSTVTETMSNAVSSKVDLAVSTAVTRALEQFASTQRQTCSKSPSRKKRVTPENVDMTNGEKNR
jgi:hypothetical protein